MTDGLRKSHLRKAPQVGLSEVGLPNIYLLLSLTKSVSCLSFWSLSVLLMSSG